MNKATTRSDSGTALIWLHWCKYNPTVPTITYQVHTFTQCGTFRFRKRLAYKQYAICIDHYQIIILKLKMFLKDKNAGHRGLLYLLVKSGLVQIVI